MTLHPSRIVRAAIRAAAVLALSAVAACTPEPQGAPASAAPVGLLVLAAGDLRGEIKPCGCSPQGQMGGLPRRLTYLEQVRRDTHEPLLVVDLGNNFPEPSPQGRLKVEFIQTVLKRAAPDAILPGPNELALGLAALDPALPYVVSNTPDPAPLAGARLIERGGRRIAVLGYLAPGAVYQGPQSAFRLELAGRALLTRWRALLRRERASEAVLLFRGEDAELAALTASGLFGAVVAGNPSADELKQVTERRLPGAGLLPQVPTKGQGVLRVRTVAPSALPAATAAWQVDWLTDAFADHPAAVAAMAAYDEQVKALFFQQVAAAESHRAASPYAGAEACMACHAVPYAIWKGAKHSHALESLQQVGKQFDPECLACHTVGLNRGGYLSQETTPQLANVQCENCHGPGRAHAADPRVKTVPTAGAKGLPDESTCRTCHQGSHSPKFAFADYWPRILHGGPTATNPPPRAQR